MRNKIPQPPQIIIVLALMVFMLLAVASTTYAAPTEKEAAQTQGYYYTVQWGDTLSQIAVRAGTTMQAIMLANPHVVNPNYIYAGTVLFIPTGNPQPPIVPPSSTCRYYHTVQWGQNMIQIGSWYGVSPYAIAEANGIYNLNRIFAGQVLCIP
ncbi:MAG: LysM peptidoglycan-binding domain-containing protein [Chloroflexi bacterium]|nr:LysM peptidoglycan-binding domain-containing protein [Chloroflexota bacterium]